MLYHLRITNLSYYHTDIRTLTSSTTITFQGSLGLCTLYFG